MKSHLNVKFSEKAFTQRGKLAIYKRIHKGKTVVHSNREKSMNEDSSTHQSRANDYDKGYIVETIQEEINEEESVDDPLSIHQDNEIKEEDMFDYDRIDIEEFKIESDNNIDEDRSSSRNFVDCGEPIKVEYIKEEINEEESVVDPLLSK